MSFNTEWDYARWKVAIVVAVIAFVWLLFGGSFVPSLRHVGLIGAIVAIAVVVVFVTTVLRKPQL